MNKIDIRARWSLNRVLDTPNLWAFSVPDRTLLLTDTDLVRSLEILQELRLSAGSATFHSG